MISYHLGIILKIPICIILFLKILPSFHCFLKIPFHKILFSKIRFCNLICNLGFQLQMRLQKLQPHLQLLQPHLQLKGWRPRRLQMRLQKLQIVILKKEFYEKVFLKKNLKDSIFENNNRKVRYFCRFPIYNNL